eukprot:3637763-Ditylum_brightwellii.AAC.1
MDMEAPSLEAVTNTVNTQDMDMEAAMDTEVTNTDTKGTKAVMTTMAICLGYILWTHFYANVSTFKIETKYQTGECRGCY